MEDDDYEYHTGERCGIDGCRSRRYRTNEQGYEECSNGHQHGLARGNVENDEDEFFGTLRGKRFRKGQDENEKGHKCTFP
jgi:RNA polymerase I-specific transcription initiation factor RRN7